MKILQSIRRIVSCLPLFAIALSGLATGGVISERWATLRSGTADDEDRQYDAVMDSAGNLITCGFLTDINTAEDFHVAKYNATTGAVMWSYTKTGASASSTYVADEARSVVIAPDGHVYALGAVVGAALSNNFQDIYLVKLNPTTGAVVWEASWGSSGIDNARDLAVDSQGDVVIVGYLQTPPASQTIMKVSSSGSLLWSTKIDDQIGGVGDFNASLNQVAIDSQDNILIGGTASFWGNSYELYVTKLASASGSGFIQWNAFFMFFLSKLYDKYGIFGDQSNQ